MAEYQRVALSWSGRTTTASTVTFAAPVVMGGDFIVVPEGAYLVLRADGSGELRVRE